MFEWDPLKAAANADKHGVTFEEAVTVFIDADALDGPDLQHSTHEPRRRRLGRSIEGRVLMVFIRRGEQAMPKRSASSARAARVGKSVKHTSPTKIDFSDIPDSSPRQLRAMRRVGRPPLGDRPRQLIAIRIDPDVLETFRKEARRRRVGYQTLMNEALGAYIRKDVA